MYTRTSEAHTDVPPRESNVGQKMTGWLVAKRTVFFGLFFPFRFHEVCESISPGIQFRKHLFVTRQMFCLVVAICFVFSKFYIFPERIRNFHSAIPALPHQPCVTIAIVVERFLFGIEKMFVTIIQE